VDRDGEEPGGSAQPSPPPADASPRPDTAVSPVIRGEPVDIPTPVWGALVREDVEYLEAELVHTGEQPPAEDGDGDGVLHTRRRPLLGWLAVAAFVATAVLHAVAVAAAARGDAAGGTALAWFAILLSVVALGLGVAAAVLDRGRVAGILGAVGGVLANPWVVMVVLRLLAP